MMLVLLFLWSSLAFGADGAPTLDVVAYDSLLSKGGWLTDVIPLFEKRCGCRVRASSVGDGGQLVGRLKLDATRGKKTAHVVVGFDQHVWERALPWIESWGKWKPADFDRVPDELRVGDGFLPFDYGALAFMADETALKKAGLVAPAKLADLLEPRFKRNLILQDPRTSTPGLTWILHVKAVLGEGAEAFWKSFKGQWLTLAAGWDASYGLFLKGEAPLVWSYVTSQAYHRENGDTEGRYRAVLFEEGQPLQIEGAAMLKGFDGAERARARAFLEFLISEEAQRRLPLKNWMMPARKDIELPASFASLPKPKRLVRVETRAAEVERELSRWAERIRR